ncbi:piggyBac transposable element-derived protein 3 [Biomphalaria glabrata]
MDMCAVTFASSFVRLEDIDTVRRWSESTKSHIQVNRTKCVQVHNEFMGGVDKMDFLISNYRTKVKTKKMACADQLLVHSEYKDIEMKTGHYVLPIKGECEHLEDNEVVFWNWQRRGHSSHHGVVMEISVENGKCIDTKFYPIFLRHVNIGKKEREQWTMNPGDYNTIVKLTMQLDPQNHICKIFFFEVPIPNQLGIGFNPILSQLCKGFNPVHRMKAVDGGFNVSDSSCAKLIEVLQAELIKLKKAMSERQANEEFVITNVAEALAETNISMNVECIDEELVLIATTSQALAETNISMNVECIDEEFVPIATTSQALAETNISMNVECIDEELVLIATTSQALAETNISMHDECIDEEFVPIATTFQEVSTVI